LAYRRRSADKVRGVGRQGDVDQAVSYGRQALAGDRKSLPSLLMVSRELGTLVDGRFADDANTRDYVDQLRELRNTARVQSADK
jgi:hypothetical protein